MHQAFFHFTDKECQLVTIERIDTFFFEVFKIANRTRGLDPRALGDSLQIRIA
jgi:hypothetical protein